MDTLARVLVMMSPRTWGRLGLSMLAAMALTASGCAPKAMDDDLVRPNPGEPFLEKLPGPLTESFDSFSDALLAACKKIITKPNAVAPREDAC
ncbi:hypothetical protein [Vitiosangium sp. GDMCC 1.1324]|uniref:hypothetical protein n=1 Tax=Vitiosangium sp. (strain GDMCC 1.1324) TaxID=2138576 RepID=UPI000D3A8604|nr:hypothetical protein [Vitiosangium sp. GDMCC 1.1324]PTL76572.1 hypothetical protein DAT35_49050 [Vitiosangium sp. GDMCC 1.1324]